MKKCVLKKFILGFTVLIFIGCENLTETKFKQSVSCEAANVDNRMLWYYADDINARNEETTIIPKMFNSVQNGRFRGYHYLHCYRFWFMKNLQLNM